MTHTIEPSVTTHGFSPVQPTHPIERLSSIDVLRGVAVLGILYMNITAFGLPWPAYFIPSAAGGDSGLNFIVWLIGALFVEGTMMGVFSMLFGASVIMITARMEARGEAANAADIYYRRNLWLIFFGLVHAYLLLWPGEILFYYGVVGLFLYPFRKLGGITLLIIGLLAFSVHSLQMTTHARSHLELQKEAREAQVLLDAGLRPTHEQQTVLENWMTAVETNAFSWTEDEIRARIDAKHGSYWEILEYLAPMIASNQSEWFYLYGYWNIIGMMLIGMAFYKWGVFHARHPAWVFWALIIIGYGIGVAINIQEARLWLANDFSVLSIYQGNITYNLGRLFTTLGHVGVVMLICKYGLLKTITARLAAVGRLALTNYIVQTIICNFIFLGVGLSLFGELQRYELYYVVAGIWLFQLWYSPIWLRYFHMGLFEWLWRSLTYWKIQPLRLPQTSMQTFEAQI